MNIERARKLIADATGRAPASIPAAAAIGTFEGWDSLAHMRLVEALEGALARPLSSGEVVSLRSLSDIAALLGPEVHSLQRSTG